MNQKEKKQCNLCLTFIHLLEEPPFQQIASVGWFYICSSQGCQAFGRLIYFISVVFSTKPVSLQLPKLAMCCKAKHQSS